MTTTSSQWQPMMRVLFWFAVLVVTVLSLLPVSELPPIASSLWDKAQHALGFLMLAVLATAAYPAMPGWRWAVGLLAFGIGIEFAQSLLGWRQGDGLDVLANGLGIAAGLGLRRWIAALARRLQAGT